MDTFKRDLLIGESIEYQVLEDIKVHYPEAYKVVGKESRWDIFIPELNKGIEVKYDKMSEVTGNIVIELEFNGKPSALSTTQSYLWVIVTPSKWIFIRPEAIRELLDVHKVPTRKFIGKGDTKSKIAHLVPVKLFNKFAIEVRII